VHWEDEARLGAVLLDLMYFDHYAEEVVRYAARWSPRESRWGDEIHERAAVPVLLVMLDRARTTRSERLAAVALGLASHAAMDRQLHPLINALARAHAEGRSHGAAHREVEKFQSICFHEAYFGRDRMGTAGIVRLVQVPMLELFANPEVGGAIDEAFRTTLSDAPSFVTLRGMARGYEQHAWLLGSPLGKTLALERDKELARPKFLHGTWGTFDRVLARAIEQSVRAMDAVWSCFASSDRDAPAARQALLTLLAPGSIDPAGDDVSLAQEFLPAL
jgi:hypothetical protein